MLEKLPALSPLTVTSPGSPPNEAMLSWTQARAASCQHFIHHAMSQPKQHISTDNHRTWSRTPALPGTSSVARERNPMGPRRYLERREESVHGSMVPSPIYLMETRMMSCDM